MNLLTPLALLLLSSGFTHNEIADRTSPGKTELVKESMAALVPTPDLPCGGVEILYNSSNREVKYLVPANARTITVALVGGDGGNANFLCAESFTKDGGAGGLVEVTFNVSPNGRIQPGQELLFMPGQKGTSVTVLCTQFGGSGGGGSSGVAIGETINGVEQWQILAVAGGGGGAWVGATSHDGGGSEYKPTHTSGFSGYGVFAGGGIRQGGTDGLCTGGPDGGGHAFYSNINQVGTYICSNDLWGQKSSSAGDAGDCPEDLSAISGGNGMTGGGMGSTFGISTAGGGGGFVGGGPPVFNGSTGGTGFINFCTNDTVPGLTNHENGSEGGGNQADGYILVDWQAYPTAQCKNNTVYVTDTSMTDIFGNAVDLDTLINNNSFSCSSTITSLNASHESFTCSDIAPQIVTLTVTDATGATGTCNATVAVLSPSTTARCKDITVQVDSNGLATITPDMVDDGSGPCLTSMYFAEGTYLDPNVYLDCSDVGPVLLTLVVTEPSGFYTDMCTATVTLQDTLPPIAVCSTETTIFFDTEGIATVEISDLLLTYIDNCSLEDATVVLTPPSFACHELGNRIVTVSITDPGGLPITPMNCQVFVQWAPIALCNDITIPILPGGQATITPLDIDDNSPEVCAGVVIGSNIIGYAASDTLFDCDDFGPNIVTLTVYTEVGDSATCTSTVTITDSENFCNLPPIAVCQDVTVFADSMCNGYVPDPQLFDGGSTDPEGQTLEFTVSPENPYPGGYTFVTLTVRDSFGKEDACQAILKVMDTIPPTIACPANDTFDVAFGLCTGVAFYPSASASDNCDIPDISVIAGLESGESFPIGTTIVTLEASDVSANRSQCSFNVTLVDLQEPTIICPETVILSVAPDNCEVPFPGLESAIAMDNCDISLIEYATPCMLPIDPGPCGDTIVKWAYNAIACDCEPFDYSGCGGNANRFDSYEECINAYCGCGSSLGPGTYNVMWQATDLAGNTSSCMQEILVLDTTGPIFTICPEDITVASYSDICGGAVNFTLSATDNCLDSVPVFTTMASGDTFPVGTTLVIGTAIDPTGNPSHCEFYVTVTDLTPPIAACRDITVALDPGGSASIEADSVDNGSTDNCEVQTTLLSEYDYACIDTGINMVILEVIDYSGNGDTCHARVTVIDTLIPPACRFASGIIYVDENAIEGFDIGEDWPNAFLRLESALDAAAMYPHVTQIWLADGEYIPTPGNNRVATFYLRSGVTVYGGFSGSETMLTQRNPTTFTSLLSGDLSLDGNPDNNSYHIVTVDVATTNVCLDGVSISKANANGSAPHNAGGGVMCEGQLCLVNVTFTNCNSTGVGAAILNSGGSAVLAVQDCVFSGNSALNNQIVSNVNGGSIVMQGQNTVQD